MCQPADIKQSNMVPALPPAAQDSFSQNLAFEPLAKAILGSSPTYPVSAEGCTQTSPSVDRFATQFFAQPSTSLSIEEGSAHSTTAQHQCDSLYFAPSDRRSSTTQNNSLHTQIAKGYASKGTFPSFPQHHHQCAFPYGSIPQPLFTLPLSAPIRGRDTQNCLPISPPHHTCFVDTASRDHLTGNSSCHTQIAAGRLGTTTLSSPLRPPTSQQIAPHGLVMTPFFVPNSSQHILFHEPVITPFSPPLLTANPIEGGGIQGAFFQDCIDTSTEKTGKFQDEEVPLKLEENPYLKNGEAENVHSHKNFSEETTKDQSQGDNKSDFTQSPHLPPARENSFQSGFVHNQIDGLQGQPRTSGQELIQKQSFYKIYPTKTSPKFYEEYLRKRVQNTHPQDVSNVKLFAEIKKKGYQGTLGDLSKFMAKISEQWYEPELFLHSHRHYLARKMQKNSPPLSTPELFEKVKERGYRGTIDTLSQFLGKMYKRKKTRKHVFNEVKPHCAARPSDLPFQIIHDTAQKGASFPFSDKPATEAELLMTHTEVSIEENGSRGMSPSEQNAESHVGSSE